MNVYIIMREENYTIYAVRAYQNKQDAENYIKNDKDCFITEVEFYNNKGE